MKAGPLKPHKHDSTDGGYATTAGTGTLTSHNLSWNENIDRFELQLCFCMTRLLRLAKKYDASGGGRLQEQPYYSVSTSI